MQTENTTNASTTESTTAAAKPAVSKNSSVWKSVGGNAAKGATMGFFATLGYLGATALVSVGSTAINNYRNKE